MIIANSSFSKSSVYRSENENDEKPAVSNSSCLIEERKAPFS